MKVQNKPIQPLVVTQHHLNQAQTLLNNFYKKPLKKIKIAGLKFKIFTVGFVILKIVLFFGAIYTSHLISELIAKIIQINGLMLDITVAVLLLYTVDKIFEAIKKKFFWSTYLVIWEVLNAAYYTLISVEKEFQEIKFLYNKPMHTTVSRK